MFAVCFVPAYDIIPLPLKNIIVFTNSDPVTNTLQRMLGRQVIIVLIPFPAGSEI